MKLVRSARENNIELNYEKFIIIQTRIKKKNNTRPLFQETRQFVRRETKTKKR